jgi:RNA polymerase sigma-70 factor (ECF subfamily)
VATAATWSDSKLLLRLRRRDRTAWDELYRTYEKRLYGFAYRLSGNQHDAADLVQETFVRALPRLDSLPPERANVGAYLFATAKNLFLKQKERAKRALPVDEVPEPNMPGDIEEDPQRAALLHRQQEEVRLATGKLAPRQRLVLALRELEDKSYAEIGELVGLNENAVAQLILRARQSLREELRLVQVDRSQLSETCQSYLPLLSAHLDGQLRGAKQAETLAHLEACEDCQKTLTDMEEAKRRYRALVPPLVAIVALREKVEDALAANGYWEAAPSRVAIHARLGRRGMLVAAIAGVALLGLLAVGVGGVGGSTPNAAAEPAQVSPTVGPVSAGSPVPGTSPTSGAPPQSPATPAETADEEIQNQPNSDGGDDSAVGDASAGGGDSTPADDPNGPGGESGAARGDETDASEGASGGSSQPESEGGSSGGSGGSRPEHGSEQDEGSPGDSGTPGGGSRGEDGSQAPGDGSGGDSGAQPDDGSRGDTGSDPGSSGEERPPEDTGSRSEEPPDETGSTADTGSPTDEGSRGTQPPPEDTGSRPVEPPDETGSTGDTGSLTDDGSRGTQPPPEDTGSRPVEPPDETGSSGDTGSLTDDGSRTRTAAS